MNPLAAPALPVKDFLSILDLPAADLMRLLAQAEAAGPQTQPPVSSPDLTAARKLAQQVLRGIADLRDARSRSGAGISLLMVADIRSQTPQK